MEKLYKKYAEHVLKRKIEQYSYLDNIGVSVITCTNKNSTLDNIIANFNRQDFRKKELIIIINKDSIDINIWLEKVIGQENINILKLREKNTLGKCLNKGVEISQYEIIAKFDDDDYYGPRYLSDTIAALKTTGSKVVVKAANYVYFVEKKLLAIRTPKEENKFVSFGNGSTLVFRKEIYNKVKFRDVSIGEDVYFCRDCIKNNIRIYSTNKYHHVYFRHPTKGNHTWKISDNDLINKYCKVIGQVEDYISYANNPRNKVSP